MIDVGFTGTHIGMTKEQWTGVMDWLFRHRNEIGEVHHGDCVGADTEFHGICLELGIPIVMHPPSDDRSRGFNTGALRVEEPQPFLKRDRAIVHETALLLATPAQPHEPKHSRAGGTWYTIRYARKQAQPVAIFWPTERN